MNRFTRGLMGAAGLALIAVVPAVSPPAAQETPARPAAGAVTAVTTAHETAVTVAAPAYTAPKRTLRYGMRGSDVKAMQQRLAALKYYTGKADGVFGQWTLEAVYAFQGVQRLQVDGIVGPLTGRALVHPRAYQSRYPRGGALRVEINLTARVLVLYQNNKIALISHVSSGRPGMATPTGRYRTTHFYPGWITVPLGRMYDSVFFIGTSYAIHGSTSVPAYPASHGCVRLPMNIAEFFHTMVRTPGTPVYIYR